MSLEEYDSKEEAYQAGYENGKFVGAMETAKHIVDKIKENRDRVVEDG